MAGTNPYPIGSTASNAWIKNNNKLMYGAGTTPYGAGTSSSGTNTTGIPIKLAPFPTPGQADAPAPVTPYTIAPTPTSLQTDVTPLSTKQSSPFQTGWDNPTPGSTANGIFKDPANLTTAFNNAVTKATPPPAPMTPPPANTPPPSNAPFDFSSLPNIQQYMNPYLDQIINKGNQAIQNSAAAKGLLSSSGTLNNIGDWTATATANAEQQAFDNFNTDRNFGANRSDEDWKRYAQQEGIDANNYQFEQNYRTNNYNSQVTAYNKLMTNKEANMQALSEGGPKMAELAANLAIALGVSEANIYTALAQMKAEGYTGQANAQGNLLGQGAGILGMFL